jgi:hypothetical protein
MYSASGQERPRSGTKRPGREDEQGQDKFPTEDKPEVDRKPDRKPEQTDPPVPGRTPVQIS